MDYLMKKRAVALFGVFVFIFAGLAGHLAYIQIYLGGQLSRQAVSQQSQLVALEVPPRGRILDRNLKPLTEVREVWRAAVFPAAVTDRQAEARTLASVLGLDTSEAERYLAGRAKLVPVDLTDTQAAHLKNADLPGVAVAKVKVRARKPRLASHILGYLGQGASSDDWTGKMGIEAYYDNELTGDVTEAAMRIFLDGRRKMIAGLGYRLEGGYPDKARKDVVLTIDRDIQEVVERVLDKAGVREGAVVVMDAGSGDIVAMAGRPDYTLDPAPATNRNLAAVSASVYDEAYENKESFLNHCLSLYQPGSVFKVVVAAAALEEGIVRPDTVFLCTGEKDDIVKCYEKGGHGLITFSQALAYSCNPVFARVGLKLGAEKLVKYAEGFGLDDGSIIGYRKNSLAEQLKLIGRDYNLVNASLGQWPVEASVVQVTAMMGAIANDGVYVPPRLVREIRGYDGKTIRTFNQGQGVRAVTKKTAGIIRALLEMVTRYGTGKQAWFEPAGAAGKTGSAQVGEGKIDAWFSGYAPLDSPRYVATVMVADGVSGGTSAAPVFREIMQGILKQRPTH